MQQTVRECGHCGRSAALRLGAKVGVCGWCGVRGFFHFDPSESSVSVRVMVLWSFGSSPEQLKLF